MTLHDGVLGLKTDQQLLEVVNLALNLLLLFRIVGVKADQMIHAVFLLLLRRDQLLEFGKLDKQTNAT